MTNDHGNRWQTGSDRRTGDAAAALSAHNLDPDVIQRSAGDVPAFDGYDITDVPLGDIMRGERATRGKSLLDVERELRIRASYIAAIENGDLDTFESPGFIAGYVRSYARYLQIDPEWTFARFCEETGFRSVHGFSAQAGRARRTAGVDVPQRVDPNEVMRRAHPGFGDIREPFLSRVEPGALGSILVLALLAIGIGYGGWAVLNDIQRLQIAPVDEAPATLAQLDPLDGLSEQVADMEQGFDTAGAASDPGLGRLYRPEPLAAPVIQPRDTALATLDPDETGTLSGLRPATPVAPSLTALSGEAGLPAVQVTEQARPDDVMIFAVRPTWVRVTSAGGATLYEGTLNAGDSYVMPEGEGAPRLRSGNAGSLYFAVNGETYGPAGSGASIVRDVELTAEALTVSYAPADPAADPDLPRVAELVLSPDAE